MKEKLAFLSSTKQPCLLSKYTRNGREYCYYWAQCFVEERKELLQGHKYIVLTVDRFTGHVSVRTVSLLKENNIIFVALSAHTNHRPRPFDLTGFSHSKNAVTKRLYERVSDVKRE